MKDKTVRNFWELAHTPATTSRRFKPRCSQPLIHRPNAYRGSII